MRYTANLRRLRRSVARVARTRYPAFLFGGRLAPNEVPVFTYHDVEADALRRDLEFLDRNGYRTIGLEEFSERTARRAARSDKAVLLTFDDARRSFHDDAFPVLREHGAKGALFVPTYWIAGAAAAPGQGGAPSESRAFMSWPELARCERSGLVDVESHAHRHALVATSERLVGFACPRTLARHDLFDWPLRHERGADSSGRPAPGTPVYESQPLLSAVARVLEPQSAPDACRELVKAGGPAFFERRDAERALRHVHAAAVARDGGAERLTAFETSRQVEAEIVSSVAAFERELGRRPRFFAYPWMLGSPRSLEVLAELGFVAAFGVAMDFRRARTQPAPLSVHCRYKNDWLRFLPGHGRLRLQHVLPRKVASFFTSQHLAH